MSDSYVKKSTVKDVLESAYYGEATLGELLEQIDNMEPVKVRPVVRGKWLDGRCTNCAWELPDYEYYGGSEIGNISCDEFKFCPNCGADMRRQNE